MIVLLSYSTNSLASNVDTISPTGGEKRDSVLIAYDDLRKVNSKLIELEYEKEINKHLNDIITNDSIAISNLNTALSNSENSCNRRVEKANRERNIAGGVSIVTIILLVLSIL